MNKDNRRALPRCRDRGALLRFIVPVNDALGPRAIHAFAPDLFEVHLKRVGPVVTLGLGAVTLETIPTEEGVDELCASEDNGVEGEGTVNRVHRVERQADTANVLVIARREGHAIVFLHRREHRVELVCVAGILEEGL